MTSPTQSPSIRVTSPTPPSTDFISSQSPQASSTNILNGVETSPETLTSPSHYLTTEPVEAEVTVENDTQPACNTAGATINLDESDISHSMPEPPAITHPEEPAEARARLPRYRRILMSVSISTVFISRSNRIHSIFNSETFR